MDLPKSFFISQEIHETEVELADGKKHKIYLKELENVHWRRWALIENSDDQDQQSENYTRMVQLSMVNPDGSQALTFEEAKKIKTSVLINIYNEILKVNKKLSAGGAEEGKPDANQS